METHTIPAQQETKEILSPLILAFFRQKIKELGQEKNEAILMESIKVFADEISHKQTFNLKEIKEELEERLKGELATKDFVRAEINQVRTELAEVKQELKVDIAEVRTELAKVKQELKVEIAEVKQELKVEIAEVKQELKVEIAQSQKKQIWFIISTGISVAVAVIGANYAMLTMLIDTFLSALSVLK